MSDVMYVRQARGNNRRARSNSPTRLVLTAPANRHRHRTASPPSRGGGGGGGGAMPARLKLRVRSPDRGQGGGGGGGGRRSDRPCERRRRASAESDDDSSSGGDRFARTFFRVVFLGATRLKSSEPSVLQLNEYVEEIRHRARVYKDRGVAIPRYTFQVSTKSISMMETQTRDVQHIPINQVHYVAADPRYPTIFSLVARGRGNRFLCHVFECSAPGQCETITHHISETFRLAYEKWMRVEENQRRVEERRERQMDMGGLEYFQEWDEHAPHGMPLYNISSYYNSNASRPRNYLRPRDELPSLPDRLIVSRSQQAGGGGGRREPEPEPYSLRYNFDDDCGDDEDDMEEVYVRQDRRRGRNNQQPVVFDIRPDWDRD